MNGTRNKSYSLFYLLPFAFCLLISCVAKSPYYRYQATVPGVDKPPCLQVLLTKYHQIANADVTFDNPFDIYAYNSNRRQEFISEQRLAQGHTIRHIKATTGLSGIILTNIKLSQTYDIVLVPTNSRFKVGGRAYQGCLRIKASSHDKISLINIIDIEKYLSGVVSCEMNYNWPASALASQTIASRTYALYRIKHNKLRPQPNDYDLTDDHFSQVYQGEARTHQNIHNVVKQTRGVVITYQGKIINSMFHSTCGGHTESGHVIFRLTDIQPLHGNVCGFCSHAKYFSWQTVIPESDIITKLKLKKVSSIKSLRITEQTLTGRALMLGIKLPDTTELLWDANKFRIALGPSRLRSTHFTVHKIGTAFEFTGHGWGHGVGMCQEGTRGMSRHNMNPLDILEFYYPQSKVTRILY